MSSRKDRLEIKACLEEIEAAVRLASRPMSRSSWLTGRRWWFFQRDGLKELGYKGKVKRYPRHMEKAE